MSTIEELNAATDASLAARTAPEAAPLAPPAKPARKRVTAAARREAAAEAARREAEAAKRSTGRAARTPRERASLPPTGTVAAYVEFLAREVFNGKPGNLPAPDGKPFGKLSPRERAIAALSITLYGAYQSSPERRAARGF